MVKVSNTNSGFMGKIILIEELVESWVYQHEVTQQDFKRRKQ